MTKEQKKAYRAAYYQIHKEKERITHQRYRETHKEQRNAYSKEYNRTHKEKHILSLKLWRERNFEKNRENARLWAERNPEKSKERSRKWREKNPEKFKELQRRWRDKNREKEREKHRRQREEFPERMIMHNAIHRMLRISDLSKNAKTRQYIGCSPGFLRNHIESLFQPGMTWNNYGEWHIDHIVPLSWFPLKEDPSLMFVASHWTNLQPLWAMENLSKHNFWTK